MPSTPISGARRFVRRTLSIVAVPLLAWLAGAQEVLREDLEAVRREGYAMLVERLEEYAQLCKREKMFAERGRALELLLLADPDHAKTRRELGYRKRDGVWVGPSERREPADRGELSRAELDAAYADAIRPFVEHMLALSESRSISARQRDALEREILRFDPKNALLRSRRGEVREGGQWLLRETLTSNVHSAQLDDWIQELRATLPRPEPIEPGDDQTHLKLTFHGAATSAVRVFATSGAEEASETCAALTELLALFNRVFGTELTYLDGCTVYLLRGAKERDVFLERHPAVSEEARRRLVQYQGAGIEGTVDWAHWAEDPVHRRDAVARIAVGWLLGQAFQIGLERPWVFEGFGSYFTTVLLGTHCTWFATPVDTRDPDLRKRLFDPDTDWMREAQTLLRDRTAKLGELVSHDVNGFATADFLGAHALATYLVEAWPEAVRPILLEVGNGRPSAEALERRVAYDVETLSWRLCRWIDERVGTPIVLVAEHTADEAREAWADLDAERRRAVVDAFRELLGSLELEQAARIDELSASVDPEALPAASPPTVFDAKKHAPKAPVKRRWLEPDDRLAVQQTERLKQPADPRAIRLGWTYEWGTGRIVRVEGGDEVERVFANALDGYAPGTDLARAVLLQELDGGHEAKSFAAFAHAYTDRDGNVYPGITLWDTWASGTLMEMPDIDALGIIHDVLGDWDTWKEPVPGSAHEALYGRIGEIFTQAKRYRELRETIADCFLIARPVHAEGYGSSLTNYHALWAHHGNDPAALAADLPDGAGWRTFIEAWIDRCQRDAKLYRPGVDRQRKAAEESELVKTAMIAAMEQQGAFR